MDKYEYKVRADEIKALIAEGEYRSAVDIADTIDWRRVKSVMMLCTISDLYKINRRYEDSLNMLHLAYDRHPGGRTIVYSLCELSIKMGDIVQAVEYYKEFVRIAPKDSGRYILQYKLYEAQEVSLEERIAVLEELKKRDYREKWAHELAYLYHRIGLGTKCVEECDELILWFGEGKYVTKAMELKMLHQPLTPDQKEKYDNRFAEKPQEGTAEEQQTAAGETSESAEGTVSEAQGAALQAAPSRQNILNAPTIRIPSDEIDIQVKTVDVGQYNTLNLQRELAEEIKVVLEQEDFPLSGMEAQMENDDTESLDLPQVEEIDDGDTAEESVEEEIVEEASEVFFGETGEINRRTERDQSIRSAEDTFAQEEVVTEVFTGETGEIPVQQIREAVAAMTGTPRSDREVPVAAHISGAEEYVVEENLQEEPAEEKPVMTEDFLVDESEEPVDRTAAIVMEQMRRAAFSEPPKELADVLSMESDGQIRLVMPESGKLEKQITGQMNIEDILAEWERLKKQNEEKRAEDVRQRVLRHTGSMFTEFEASVRDGLLEQLENGESIEDTETFFGGGEDSPSPAATVVRTAFDDSDDQIMDLSEVEELSEIEEYEEPESSEALEQSETFFGVTAEIPVKLVEEMLREKAPDSEDDFFQEEVIEESAETAAEEAEEQPEAEPLQTAQEEVSLADAEHRAEEDAEESEKQPEERTEKETTKEKAEETEKEIGDEIEEETEKEIGDEIEEEIEEHIEKETEEEIEEKIEEKAEAQETADTEQKTEASEEKSSARPSAPRMIKEHVEQEKASVRTLTKEERELYGSFIQGRSSKEQLINAIDNLSMAAYTGNMVITGEEGMNTLTLAKNIIREIQMTDSNFSGKIAKISGDSFNRKSAAEVLGGLANGALIIQKASLMNQTTVNSLYKNLQRENPGIIVFMLDGKKAMNRLLGSYPKLKECFTARVDVEALSNDALVAFGKRYAREKEYSIDEMGMLALHTRISDMQTIDHAVTILEVKEIMDDAIASASRKTVGHFFDILTAKRYDDEDMIILREKDFM